MDYRQRLIEISKAMKQTYNFARYHDERRKISTKVYHELVSKMLKDLVRLKALESAANDYAAISLNA